MQKLHKIPTMGIHDARVVQLERIQFDVAIKNIAIDSACR
jgi:hypothetical protein